MVMFQNRVFPKLVGSVVPDPRWMVFMLPLSWHGEYRVNGVVARPLDVFMAGGPSGYTTVGEARNTVAIGVRKSRLERDMRARRRCGSPAAAEPAPASVRSAIVHLAAAGSDCNELGHEQPLWGGALYPATNCGGRSHVAAVGGRSVPSDRKRQP